MMSAGSRNTWIPTLEEGIQQVNNISHNWNPIMPGNEDAIISWIPVTPRTDMQGNQMENENWQDLIGIYKDLLQGETLDLNLLQDPNPTLPPPMLQSSQNPDCIANSIPFPDHSFNQASRSELDAVCSSTIDSFKSPEFCINNKRVPETFNFSEGYENQLHVIGDSSSVIEGNKQFVDDLKTPEKKTPSKRKKHRPKVVTESNRQPKDPKKNTTLKRKYVKKKGNEVSKPGVDQNGVNGKRKYVRKNEQNISCKRRLNFDFDFDLNAHPQDIISNSIPIKDNQRNGNNQWDQYVYEGAIQTGYASCINLQKASQSLNSDERNLWNANDMDSIVMYQNLLLGFEPRNNNINDFASIFMEKSQKSTIISASTTSTWDSPLKKLTAKPNSTNTAKGRGKKRKIGGLIDDIVCKFEGLRICEERENGDGAIVLYRDERGLVPFEVVKKRKARPKVDLDSETERVWRVLMGKEGSEGTETCDGDKEKWWEDERRVFRGRVDSFIARMHLVQGDRRFSQWKGSVVDSVIGVFLTQNVTDHLSSSAFMSLAAKFPLNSTTTKQTTCRDTPCEPIEIASKETIDGIISSSGSNSEPEISIIDKAETSSNDQNHDSMMGTNVLKVDEKNKEFDWDSLRKEAMSNGEKRERGKDRGDSIDYETMRRAHVNKISDAIKERGMNNMLADRIHDFLNRLVRDHGSIDLEWLRDIPTDKAKDYLLSIRGLGLKSVECVRLLSLHHLAFPVDTNVGRIAVRLGWVPLQPLPESLQLHLLEMYPVLESIQKYLWPRLCKLDQLTLYELHYQMITFGKVFCTKSKPNCNACPMRAECRHFASAFASARLALPGPQEKRIVPQTPHTALPIFHMPMALPPNEGYFGKECAPIIEEPKTPEPEDVELSIKDIEDQYYDDDDSDEIPTIKLNMEEFTTNLQNVMQDSIELQEDMSKALVALKPEAASIPTPKLKNVSRLRTEHQVYELPDSHPLLEGFDKRESDDPSPYLLSIWTPGETANSTQIPEKGCPDQESCKLCDRETCFSCNTIKEANLQVVRGTILIPCRTATRGSFPLNGTYFQVNEVFADHESSLNPIDVPRAWIWNLPRRTVYFGTSVSTIFKGLTTEGIQYCFWRGFVCVRGFDQKTRAPRPLMARLHFPASKMVKRRHIDEELNKDKLAD